MIIMMSEYGDLTPEEIEDLTPVELGEDELVAIPYEAPPELVPRSPFKVPTDEDKVRVHRINLGGACVGGYGEGRWAITDCGLSPKGMSFITRNYGRDNKPGHWLGETDKPVDCLVCCAIEDREQSRRAAWKKECVKE